jgi:AcrR family transcriptional regulator
MDMTSSSVRRIDEIGEESRRHILDAAEELFAEKASTNLVRRHRYPPLCRLA